MKKLVWVIIICFFFMVCEIIGGVMSNSLAILTDAAHMLSDVAGFMISLFSIWIGQKSANCRQTYGWHRAEVVGAVASIVIIWVMVVWLFIEATDRIIHPDYEINAEVMLITAFISLACNIFNLIILDHFPMPCIKKSHGDHAHSHGFMDAVTSIYKPHGGHDCAHHHHHDHDHDHGHSHGHDHCHGHDHHHDHENDDDYHHYDNEN